MHTNFIVFNLMLLKRERGERERQTDKDRDDQKKTDHCYTDVLSFIVIFLLQNCNFIIIHTQNFLNFE